MTVDFPPFTQFSLSTSPKRSPHPTNPTLFDLHDSTRDLSYLLVSMFQPLGSSAITVAFSTPDLAALAEKEWPKGDCNIVSLLSKGETLPSSPRKNAKKKKKKGGGGGFMKAMSEVSSDASPADDLICGVLPPKTECLILPSPSPQTVPTLQRLSSTLTDSTLIIALNAASGTWDVTNGHFSTYSPAFSLSARGTDVMEFCAYGKGRGLFERPKKGDGNLVRQVRERPACVFEDAAI